MPGRVLRTAEELPEGGIYLLPDQNHQLPKVVILLRGETFPPSTECSPPAPFVSVQATAYASGCDGFSLRHSNVPALGETSGPNESTHWCFGMCEEARANSAQKPALEKRVTSFVRRKAILEVS